MNFTKDAILQRLIAAYQGVGSTEEGSFAGDVFRACADEMAKLWSMSIDGLARRAFVSTAVGEDLTQVCADRGVERREGERDEELRARTLAKLASLPASGNADHYTAWCLESEEILRVRVLPLARGAGTVDIVAVDRKGRCPDPAVLASVQTIVDENRPIGADAQVLGAVETAVNITAEVVLMDGALVDTVTTAYTERLSNFCRDNALLSGMMSYAKLQSQLLETEGVADVRGFTVNGEAGSLTLDDYTVPVAGVVSLIEVSA